MTAVYLQLAAYACATTFSPGPNNILLFSSTSRYGIRKCWPLIFGIWAGLITVMLLCGFGCAWLGELVPQIVPVAKYVGAAYILYLAYRTLMRSPGAKKEAGPSGKPLSYVNGFLLQFLNVHILMLGIAAYSGYILPHGYTVPAVLCFSVIMAACAATGNLIWATLCALLYPLYSRYYNLSTPLWRCSCSGAPGKSSPSENTWSERPPKPGGRFLCGTGMSAPPYII